MMPATKAVVTAEATGLLPCAEPCQHHKATLLSIIQAFVEGPGGIGELLERGCALTHDIRPHRQALNRILRTVSARARRKPFRTLLGKVAKRALNSWPALLLLGVQLKSGMKRRDTRVTECRNVFGSWTPALYVIESAGSPLRVG